MSAEQVGTAVPWGDESSDAELITAARAGDLAAFGALYERHAAAARTVARQYTRSSADADDVVSDAFAKVLSVVRAGGGPDVAFRAYLFTVVRRLAHSRVEAGRRVQPTDDLATFETAFGAVEGVDDPALAGFERGVVARAYGSLPERWQAVLWYTEIERLQPAQVAPLLGLTANGVAALAYRAREGLREAYLQQHLVAAPSDDCRSVNGKLGAYVRGGLAKRETAQVRSHLETCETCRDLVLELGDVNHGLRGIIAPLVLGVAGLGALGAPLPVGLLSAAAGVAGSASAAGSGAAVGGGTAVGGGAALGGGASAGAGTGAAVGSTAVAGAGSGAAAAGAGAATAGTASAGAAAGGAAAGATVGAGATTAGAGSAALGAGTALAGAGASAGGATAVPAVAGVAGSALAGTSAAAAGVTGAAATGTGASLGAVAATGASVGSATAAGATALGAAGVKVATVGAGAAGASLLGAGGTAATAGGAAAGLATVSGATALAAGGAASGAATVAGAGGIGGLLAVIPGGMTSAVAAGVVGVSLAVGSVVDPPARPPATAEAPGPQASGPGTVTGPSTDAPGLGPLLGGPPLVLAPTPSGSSGPATPAGPGSARDAGPRPAAPVTAGVTTPPVVGTGAQPAPTAPLTAAALSAAATAETVLVPGTDQPLSITVTNTGQTDATDLRAALVLPPGARVAGAAAGSGWQPCADDPSDFCLPALAGGTSSQLAAVVAVAGEGTVPGSATVGLEVDGPGLLFRASVPVTVAPTPPRLVAAGAAPAPLVVDVPQTVTVDVANHGQATARDVVATVVLPDGVRWTGASTGAWACAAGSGDVQCRIPELAGVASGAPPVTPLGLTVVADPDAAGAVGLPLTVRVTAEGGATASHAITLSVQPAPVVPPDPPAPPAPPAEPPAGPPAAPPADPPANGPAGEVGPPADPPAGPADPPAGPAGPPAGPAAPADAAGAPAGDG